YPQLSMMEKDYYLDTKLIDFVTSLKDAITTISSYVYIDKSIINNNITDNTILIETIIAKILKPIEQRREIDKLYYKSTLIEFISNVKESIKNKDNMKNK